MLFCRFSNLQFEQFSFQESCRAFAGSLVLTSSDRSVKTLQTKQCNEFAIVPVLFLSESIYWVFLALSGLDITVPLSPGPNTFSTELPVSAMNTKLNN